MTIDWFTFTAQIINFLVLVGLLRWFLYDPIVRAMQTREDKIAERLREAERTSEVAEEKARHFESKNREFDEQQDVRLKQAHQEAEEHRDRLKEEHRAKVDRKRDEWLEALEREREEIVEQFRQQIGELADEAARKTLAELADDELETRMLKKFVDRIEQLDQQQNAEIAEHLADGESEVSIRSAFEIPQQWRERLSGVLQNTFQHRGEVAFERGGELICGIELDVGGYRFDWNVDEHLRQLSIDFESRLAKKR